MFVCFDCAVERPATVRQLITHVVMFGGVSFCGHQPEENDEGRET